MSASSSPFTLDHLAAILDEDGIDYRRSQTEPLLLANFCCDHVPHALRFVVNAERGYFSIAQHDLLTLSARVATASRIGEACRFALFANGEAMFGSFMLYGYHTTNISYCAVVPTAGALLSAEQVRSALLGVCRVVDLAYPLLQQVLWGGLSAEEAQSFYRRRTEQFDQLDTDSVSGESSTVNVSPDADGDQGCSNVIPGGVQANAVPQWSRQEIRERSFAFEVEPGTVCHPECTTAEQRETSGSLAVGGCGDAFFLPAGDTALGWPVAFEAGILCAVCQRPIVAPSQQS